MDINNLKIYSTTNDATAVTAACEAGVTLFEGALEKSYKCMPASKLKDLMIVGIKMSGQDGLVKLLYSEDELEDEVFFKTAILPTIAIVTAGTYCCLKENEGNEEPNCVFATSIAKMISGLVKYFVTADTPAPKRMAAMATTTVMNSKLGEFCRVFPVVAPEDKAFFNAFTSKYQKILRGSYKSDLKAGKEPPVRNFSMLEQVSTAFYGYDNTIFVYGTLMKGERANYMLDGCYYGGEFTLEGYGCYDLGHFPAIANEAGASVVGEVYYAPDNIVEELDEYEGEGDLYVRKTVPVKSKYGTILAQAYIYNGRPLGEKVEGRWHKK